MRWFKHDSNSLHDCKIEKLIMRYGIEGYGLYFACVEMIAEKLSAENTSFELEHDAEILAHKFKIDSHRIEEMMQYCVELGLFQYNAESNRIFCYSLARRVDGTTAQSPQFRALLQNIDLKKLKETSSNLKFLPETCSRLEQTRLEENRLDSSTVPVEPSISIAVEKTEEKPKKRTKQPPDPRIKSLIDYFFQKFVERRGFEPTVNGGVWGAVFKRLLRDSSEKTIRVVIDSFFDYDKRTRLSIYDFERSFDNVYGRLHDLQEKKNAQRRVV